MQAFDSLVLRNEIKLNFLKDYFKDQLFEIYLLPADSSFRTYKRVIIGNKNFILMDSPPSHYSLTPFINIAEFLFKHGFSTPNIYHIDHENGFLLLEDFGSKNIGSSLLEQTNSQNIYKLIIELLIELQTIAPPDNLSIYDAKTLLKELEIYTDWYVFKL